MATRQQLEQQLVAAHRTGNVQAAQQAAYAIRQYDQSALSAQVPSINAPPPIERVPKPTFGSWLENVGIGIGEGLGEQVQGIGELAQRGVSALGAYAKDPLKASAAAFMGALAPAMRGFTQPAQVAKDVGAGVVETGKQMYQQATSGPVGLGTVIGQNIDIMPGPDLPGGKRRPTMAELDVYHGTPHTFEPEEGAPLGRFRSSKIGTGEGAQAYGYGLYLAENQKVAGGYRSSLSPQPFPDKDPRNGAWIIYNNKGEDAARKYLSEDFPADQVENALAEVKAAKSGNVYKVDLPDAKIEQMLDWDKPLSEQPKAVRNAFNEAFSNPEIVDDELMGWYLDNPNPTGKALYSQLMTSDRFTGNGQKEASRVLNELGVPGIKYFDEGSRNTSGKWIAKHPKGGENVFNSENELNAFIKRNPEYSAIKPKQTRNFVVFPGEEQNLTILERDGVKAEVQKPKTPSFTDALNNLVRPDLEDDQVFSKPLPPADADNLDYVGKFGASSTGTGGMHVSVRDGIKNAGPQEFFFYDNNDEPLGFARLTKNKKQASINMIAFNEEGRGRGFGKSFYKYLLDDLGVEVKSDKEITQGTAGIYESLAKEYPTRVDDDGRVVISPKSK